MEPAPSTKNFPVAVQVFIKCLHMDAPNQRCSSQGPAVPLICKIFFLGDLKIMAIFTVHHIHLN